MIKITVIVPVYNSEKYLKECLDSILCQTLKDIEIICINDGSTDYSYNILEEYRESYKNIIILSQKNRGAGVARNQGIEHARGKYLCFIDSDDYYPDNQVLETLYTYAERKKVSICGGNLMAVTWDKKKIKDLQYFPESEYVSFREHGDIYYFTSYIYNKRFIQENNIKFPPLIRYEDPVFLLNAMVHTQGFYALNKLIYAYRFESKERKYSFDMVIDILMGIKECFSIAKDNNFIRTYELHLKNALYSRFEMIYPYAIQNRKEVWDLIDEINKLNIEWMGTSAIAFQNIRNLKKYTADLVDKYNHLKHQCDNAKEIVIYGAGEVGKYFLKNFGKEYSNIAGFAVSKRDKDKRIEGYEVNEIQNYKRDSLVIVAVGEQYAEEILHNLEILHFENIYYMEYSALKMIEVIKNNDKGVI